MASSFFPFCFVGSEDFPVLAGPEEEVPFPHTSLHFCWVSIASHSEKPAWFLVAQDVGLSDSLPELILEASFSSDGQLCAMRRGTVCWIL